MSFLSSCDSPVGVGSMENKTNEDLMESHERCILIVIKNKHSSIQLRCIQDYVITGLRGSNYNLPQRISPGQKDAILFHPRQGRNNCSGFVRFLISKEVSEQQAANREERSVGKRKRLVIAWDVFMRENTKQAKFAIGIDTHIMTDIGTLVSMIRGKPQKWFQRRDAGTENINFDYFNYYSFNIVGSMTDEDKTVIEVEICDFEVTESERSESPPLVDFGTFLDSTNVDTLVSGFQTEYCVGIHIKNNHDTVELRSISTYLKSGHPALHIPRVIGPKAHDRAVFITSMNQHTCSGLLTFFILPLEVNPEGFLLSSVRRFSPEVIGLAIAWATNDEGRNNKYAIALYRLTGDEKFIYDNMINGNDIWFQNAEGRQGGTVQRTHSSNQFQLKVEGKMNNGKHTTFFVNVYPA